jgi:hypothetical protein
MEGFDAPDIRFYNKDGLDLYTNVYRRNIMDMAYHKITDDGMTHTSSAMTANFGCYIGFGSFNISDSYGGHVWTRDIGRMLIEVISMGYFDRAIMAVDKLHELLYYPSVRFKIPHWKRVANLIANDENDLFNEGNENDGHASIMMAIYSLYRKGGVGKDWLIANRDHLKAAADYYLWQESHPVESNFNGILYSHSETSSQTFGGYDLYANIISSIALELYARLFDVLDEGDYDEAFPMRLVTKDLGLAVDLARDVNMPVELTGLVEQIHRRARVAYGDDAGEISVVRLYEELAGSPLRLGNDEPDA